MTNFGWEYPPGVSPNDPHITGEIQPGDIEYQFDESKGKITDAVEDFTILCDEAGILPQKDWEKIDALHTTLIDKMATIVARLEPPEEY